MTITSPMEVFFDQLKDLYSATAQAAATLPDLEERASEKRLAALLHHQAAATRRHLKDIAAIFEAQGWTSLGRTIGRDAMHFQATSW